MPPSWERAEPVEQTIMLDCWYFQIRHGYLNRAGLHNVRMRLLFGGEFDPGPWRDALLIIVGDAIADDHGSPLAVPDDVRELDGRKEW
jgi:hypothetical protein